MSDPSKGLRFGAGSAFASTGGADLVKRLPRPGFPEPTYFNETKWFSCPGRPHAQDPNKLPLKYAGKLAPDKINHPCLVCDKAIYDGRIALNLKKYVDLLANNECKSSSHEALSKQLVSWITNGGPPVIVAKECQPRKKPY